MATGQDKETLLTFVAEAREHLDGIEGDLMTIEQGGAEIDAELVNRVFRAVHTIKGGAGFLGLDRIKELAHAMENVMNRVRKQELVPSPGIISPLLDSADVLNKLIDAIGSDVEYDIGEQLRVLEMAAAAGLGEKSGPRAAGSGPRLMVEDKREQVPEAARISSSELISRFAVSELELEKVIADGSDIFVLEYDLVPDLEKHGKTLLDFIDELNRIGKILDSNIDIESVGDLDLDSGRLQLPLSVLFSTVLDRELLLSFTGLDSGKILLLSSGEDTGPLPAAFIPEPLEPEPEEINAEMAAETVPAVKAGDGPSPLAKAVAEEASLRVNVKTLDALMSLAGELVLTRNQHLQMVASSDQHGLKLVSQRLNMVTADLQEAVMSTRMQTIGRVFNRFKRLVHDSARKYNKEINLVIEGEEVELDKSIIEAIGDPLTHLVRNAVDHGIELPQERVRAGKPAAGTLYLGASYEGGQVIIIIEDDGAGIRPEKIRDKAVELGLFSRAQLDLMTEQEIIKLVFLPGLTTASQVTELSGRGVGMDVVLSNLSKIGGLINIDTQVGQGTVISIKLPLTLAIIPCLIVSVENERYAIPQVNMQEMVRIPAAQVKERIERIGQALVLRFRGRLLPLITLREALGLDKQHFYEDLEKDGQYPAQRQMIEDRRGVVRDELGRPIGDEEQSLKDKRAQGEDRRQSPTGAYYILVLWAGELQYGLIIDRVLDSEEVVVKPLGAHLRGCKVYAGAAVQGDGKVAMILDIAGLSSIMNLTALPEKLSMAVSAADKMKKADSRSFLLARNSPREQLAVPMAFVSRIEKIDTGQIKITGGRRNMQYMNGSLPLVGIEEVANVSPLDESSGYCYVIVVRYGVRDVGVLVTRVFDIEDVSAAIDEFTHRQPGIQGSAIIRDEITLVVDLHEVIATILPEWAAVSKSAVADEKKARVLVVEDSSFFRKKITGFIEEAGYETFVARDGLEALDILASQQVDVVLTDIEMPNLDGLELARRIRASDKFGQLPIIAITSVAGESAEAKGLAAGINDYLVKLEREKIIEKIKSHLSG